MRVLLLVCLIGCRSREAPPPRPEPPPATDPASALAQRLRADTGQPWFVELDDRTTSLARIAKPARDSRRGSRAPDRCDAVRALQVAAR